MIVKRLLFTLVGILLEILVTVAVLGPLNEIPELRLKRPLEAPSIVGVAGGLINYRRHKNSRSNCAVAPCPRSRSRGTTAFCYMEIFNKKIRNVTM